MRQTLGKIGRWLLLLLLLGQSGLCVSAAAEGLERRTEATERMQQEFQVKGGRWAEEIPQGGGRKRQQLLWCTLLNGSAWSTQRKYMSRDIGKCDIFFGMEHRLRTEEMEEQLNREAKKGWRFAADAARITDETGGSE